MKKSLLALAVLGAFAGVASAQTSVTIYGSFDGGVRSQTNVDAAGNSKLTMGSNGTYYSNRLGFKGVEDLGGGLNAHFALETGFNTGTGALDNPAGRLFNRGASVGLGGTWGSIDFGHQYTTVFKTMAAYDPLGYKYTGIDPVIGMSGGTGNGATRFDNDIQYTGTFGPVTARAELALGEVAGSSSVNSAQSVGLNYEGGPLALGAAYLQRKDGTTASAATFDYKNYTLGGAYKFGPARVAAGYSNQKQASATVDTTNKNAWVGLSYAVAPATEITGAYFQTKLSAGVNGAGDGKKNLLMLSATYALSKRTNLYALIDQATLNGALRIGGNAAMNQDRQRDVAVGINHLF